MWPKDSGDPRRAAPKAAAGKGAGAKGRLTVVESLKAHVRSKGAFGMLAVGREFRRLGSGTGRLDDSKVRQGLEAIGFTCTDIERAEIEKESSAYGYVEVKKLLDLCRPPVSIRRMDQILAAFEKMDPKESGRISTADIMSLYDARNHPLYQNGDSTEKELTEQFVRGLTVTSNGSDNVVSREEWVDYYSGVSATIDSDAYFDLMIRSAFRM